MNQRTFMVLMGWLIAGLFLAPFAFAQAVAYPTPGGVIPTQVLGDYSPYPRTSTATSSGVNAAATAEASVRTPNGTVKIPVSASANVSKSAIARAAVAASRVLGPVGAAATAVAVAEAGVQICIAGGICRDNSKPGTLYRITMSTRTFESFSAQAVCENWFFSSALTNDDRGWYGNGVTGSDDSPSAFRCRTYANDYTVLGTKTADSHCASPRVLSGGKCVNPDGSPAVEPLTDAQAEQTLQEKMDADYNTNKRLYDAIQEDIKKAEAQQQKSLNPIQADTPVQVTAPPVSTPEKTTKTDTRTKPDGSTETATTKEKTTVTPKVEGTTVGDTKITYPSQTTITTTTINNTTNETTTNTTVINNEAQDSDSEDYTFTDSVMPEVPQLYEQKYPDGISGVWRDHKPDMESTQFWQGVKQMFPTFGAGSCPAWFMSFNLGALGNYGTVPFNIPCWIFQAIGLILMTTAAFTARKIIF